MTSDLERQLRARIERLEDELAEAREELRRYHGPEATQMRRRMQLAEKYGLTVLQAEMLWHMLARPGLLTRVRLYDLLYANRVDGGPDPRTLDVHLCYLRKALRKHGVRIELPRDGTFTVVGVPDTLEALPPLDTVALRRQIMELLARRDCTTQHMARNLHVSAVYIAVVLRMLAKEGHAVCFSFPKKRAVTWSLTLAGRAALDKELQALSKSVESEHQKAA